MERRFDVRGGVTTAVLQLVWQCDWAVLFVDVLYFFTPVRKGEISPPPGVVHCFLFLWSMSNRSKSLTLYICVDPIEKFWRRERKIWEHVSTNVYSSISLRMQFIFRNRLVSPSSFSCRPSKPFVFLQLFSCRIKMSVCLEVTWCINVLFIDNSHFCGLLKSLLKRRIQM